MNSINPTQSLQDATVASENDEAFYKTLEGNWFTAQPYGFKITFSDQKTYVCFLPISPSNLSVTTHFATNMVPTLYGTVEEHSDVRYFDIAIEGTTGMAPKYNGIWTAKSLPGPPKIGQGDDFSQIVEVANSADFGRQSFSITKTIPLGGFFSKTLGALSAIKNSALELIGGSENTPGISPSQTGYTAFHTLYKMLLRHKKDAAGVPISSGINVATLGSLGSITGIKPERKVHPIVFFNYKDGNQYNVVIRNFTMRRSADNPMLYYYSISMRGYALTGLKGKPEIDNQAQRLRELGLDGVSGSSLLGTIKKKANSAKGILGAAAGGINVLGS